MKDIRILFADDEAEIRELLEKYLSREGYHVDTVSDGEGAVELFKKREYNLVILDIMLPGTDGIEVCKLIRDRANIPIIMLTAKDSEIDRILGLRIGADDYITKPFSMDELIARVKAQLRRFYVLGGDDSRNSSHGNGLLEFGSLSIDLDRYLVYKDGEEVKLTSTEFKILKILIADPGKVYTKKQIFNKVWGDDYLEADNNVMVHIRRLRKKIEEDPQNPQFIITVWGIGYRFSEGE
ncbi:MAG: response regulator transcription factor [Firmicutes bacterium]|nr:response regulator transcription factor [Bacillota bacterium]